MEEKITPHALISDSAVFSDEIAQIKQTYFQSAIDREGTDSEKLELRQKLFATEAVIPMWVADMDLPTPPFVLAALRHRLDHPILGYNLMPDALYESIIKWQQQHGFQVQQSDIHFTHNVANGFHMAIQAVTRLGEGVVVMPPVYPPFMTAASQSGRHTIHVPLLSKKTQQGLVYEINFEALASVLAREDVTALLMCHPHNPIGRVWLEAELSALVDLCLRYEVVIISDEIHSDLLFQAEHKPIASLSPEAANITMTLSSPGKTFNLGGLQIGYALITNAKLREKFVAVSKQNSIQDLNTFAMVALMAAYSHDGKVWQQAVISHIKDNMAQLQSFLTQKMPEVTMTKVEATYLAWLDFSAWQLPQSALKTWLVHEAKLGLSNGDAFFAPDASDPINSGLMRMNLAVSTETLKQALSQLREALAEGKPICHNN